MNRGNRSSGASKRAATGRKPAVEKEGAWALGLVRASRDLICLCRKGRITYINRAGIRMLGGRSAGDVVGRRFADFIHHDYRDAAADILDLLADEKRSVPLKLTRRSGRLVDAEIKVTPMGGASGDTAIVQARDITELIRSAESLMRKEIRFRCLVDNALDMICIFDHGRITFVNAAGMRMLGATEAAQIVGRPMRRLVHPDYREVVDSGLESIATEGTTVPLKFVRLDRKVIDVEIAVVRMGAGEVDTYMMEARDITEQVRSAESLRDREERLRGIVDTVAEGIITINDKGVIESFNLAAEGIFGYGADEILGKNLTLLMPDPHRGRHDGYIRRYLRTRKPRILGVAGRDELGLRKDGGIFPMELSVSELRHGKQRLFTGIVRDITHRKQAEEEIRAAHEDLEKRVQERTRELTQEIVERRNAEEKLRLAAQVIEATKEAVLLTDMDFRVTSVNPAFTEITGYSAQEVIGKRPHFHAVLKKDKGLYAEMGKALGKGGSWEGEIWNKRKNGDDYAARLSISAIYDEMGKVKQYAILIGDITKRKQDEERIRYQANYDALTGLPNRTLFLDRLVQALAAMRRAGRMLSLLFIDLDGFKLVNDTLGHDVGDLLLQETANRLAGCIRDDDTVARLGGDEFTIIMPNVRKPQDAPIVAQRVLDALSKPYYLREHEAFVSGSIGITIFPNDGSDASELLKNADTAMYRAKDKGKANYQFFTIDLNEEVRERMVLKNGLIKASERGEFELHYQPRLELDSRRVTGVEALLRWHSRDLGTVPPDRFIPVLEETGLLIEVGKWVIRTAVEQHKKWRQEGLPPIRVAINLSARQLREPDFAATMKRILKEAGVGPKGVEVEITESMLMTESEYTVAALAELHDMGIHVALDDFGTGYSSLSYLKRFPIDTIKIDRSFVADIANDPDDAEMIRAIINMGHVLNRRVVAEGVETEEQMSLLDEYRCHEIQGYLFSPPLTADQLTSFFKDNAIDFV